MRSRTATTDFYQTLQVGPEASPEEIKAAFRRLSKRYHPDTNPGSGSRAGERFKEVTEAYTVLSDPEKRREYDRIRSAGPSSAGPSHERRGGPAYAGGRPFTRPPWTAGGGPGGPRPRNVSFASPGRQLAARAVDLAATGAIVLTARAMGANTDAPGRVLFTAVLAAFAYETLLVGLLGRTLGMMAARVKAVRTDGGPPGWRRAAARMSLALPGLLAVSPTGDLLAWGVMLMLASAAMRFFLRRRGRRPGWLSRATLAFGSGMIIFAFITSFWVLLSFITLVYILSPLLNQNGRAVPDQLAGVVIVNA